MIKIFTLVILSIFSTALFAQVVNSDTKYAGASIQLWGDGFYAFGGEYEQGFLDNITAKAKVHLVAGGIYSSVITHLAGNYYFNDLFKIDNDNLELYGGVGIARLWNIGTLLFLDDGYFAVFPAHVGGRYFFNDKLGVNLELLGGRRYNNKITAQLGLNLKLGK